MNTNNPISQHVAGARRQKAIVEYHDGAWLVMDDAGQISQWDSAAFALASIQRRANRGNKTITLTTVEWRNVPEGFTAPTGDQTGLLKRKRTR